MADSQIFLIAAGVHSLGFAVFHLFFWRIFDWKEELPKMTLANRAIIQIFNVLAVFLFGFMALLCFRFHTDLLETSLGLLLTLFFAGFWLVRLILQWIYLPYRHRMIWILNGLFILGFLLFLLPVIFSLIL